MVCSILLLQPELTRKGQESWGSEGFPHPDFLTRLKSRALAPASRCQVELLAADALLGEGMACCSLGEIALLLHSRQREPGQRAVEISTPMSHHLPTAPAELVSLRKDHVTWPLFHLSPSLFPSFYLRWGTKQSKRRNKREKESVLSICL